MMMCDSPAIGVALPRNKRGRGVTLSAESLPVEVQTFYTPDPAKLDKYDEQDWEHLRTLTPLETDHPRKTITEPRPLIDEDEELEPTYNDWATTRITLFDGVEPPVHEIPAALPSNVVALGARKAGNVRFEPDPVEVDDEAVAADDDEGYGEISEGIASDLAAGDLVLSDSTLGIWVVVESVEPDIVDEDAMAIEYRELDSGDEGLMTVSDNEVLTYRRPIAA
jgi:hypothetical protein